MKTWSFYVFEYLCICVFIYQYCFQMNFCTINAVLVILFLFSLAFMMKQDTTQISILNLFLLFSYEFTPSTFENNLRIMLGSKREKVKHIEAEQKACYSHKEQTCSRLIRSSSTCKTNLMHLVYYSIINFCIFTNQKDCCRYLI